MYWPNLVLRITRIIIFIRPVVTRPRTRRTDVFSPRSLFTIFILIFFAVPRKIGSVWETRRPRRSVVRSRAVGIPWTSPHRYNMFLGNVVHSLSLYALPIAAGGLLYWRWLTTTLYTLPIWVLFFLKIEISIILTVRASDRKVNKFTTT